MNKGKYGSESGNGRGGETGKQTNRKSEYQNNGYRLFARTPLSPIENNYSYTDTL
jgi:hypothetical protein